MTRASPYKGLGGAAPGRTATATASHRKDRAQRPDRKIGPPLLSLAERRKTPFPAGAIFFEFAASDGKTAEKNAQN
jgi:hypothetical protein